MNQYIMKGGSPLVGDVVISGAKNAALGILAASIMTDEDVIVEFGNNKNCRSPMRKQAIAEVEKAEKAAE